MSDLDIYDAQDLGRPLGPGRAAALILIDFVNGFLDPAILGGGNIAEAARATAPLLAAAREGGAPVIFTRIVYAADGSDAGLWCRKAPRLAELTEDTPASHVIDSLAPRPGELVIRKRQASAFFDTGLAAQLAARGIDTLVVTGCTTSGCVRASVVDAIGHEIRPMLVAPCIGDRAQAPHEAALFDMGQKYADVIDEALAARLLARA